MRFSRWFTAGTNGMDASLGDFDMRADFSSNMFLCEPLSPFSGYASSYYSVSNADTSIQNSCRVVPHLL